EQDRAALESPKPERQPATGQIADDIKNQNQLSHPHWMLAAIRHAWPEYADLILNANNRRPPMCLRVNGRYCSRESYLAKLSEADMAGVPDSFTRDGIVLEKPVPVGLLPDFDQGAVSVQDTAAQLACDILDVHRGHSVLDACAAPGGKTAHILERADNQLTMHAVDISESRCNQLQETLRRLKLDAQVFAADASDGTGWPSPNNGYDRILIDAPCSGLGVIRRHPDIKHHRRIDDIANLREIQRQLLNQLWLLLKPEGLMLYMTCSILPEENIEQINYFLDEHPDAYPANFEHPHALDLEFGKQTLPGVHGMDGFYYCLLQKAND
ncbi:MAG: 16S rRNA (cytosine(967)-C(5))-methyltransferase RsmB, partial [Gammaproteobacteria bacterium]|nr:16S rRNA (cytosine(967)-C(5))-methyltransferase RsmB [Gammaproteobacteria bacterium]